MLREKKLCPHRFTLNNIVSSLPWISELCEDIVVVLLPLLHHGGRVCHDAPLWYLGPRYRSRLLVGRPALDCLCSHELRAAGTWNVLLLSAFRT